MVTVKVTGDLVVKSIEIDSRLSIRGRRAAAGHGARAVNEALRSAQELASAKLGGIAAGSGGSGFPGCDPALSTDARTDDVYAHPSSG